MTDPSNHAGRHLRSTTSTSPSLEHLQQDARSSNLSIAGLLGVSEGTVRTRIRRMEDDKVIRIAAITDVQKMGLRAYAFIGINVDPDRIGDVVDALVEIPEMPLLIRSLGEHDLFGLLATPTRGKLADIVFRQIDVLPGVRSTETIEAVGGIKHSYTWARIF